MGETMDTTPMPKPPIIRYTTSWEKFPHTAQPMAETENIRAAMNIVFLRPRKSLSMPATITPMIDPMRAQPTNQPSRPVDRPNWALTISVVPEITAVS